MTGPEVGYWTEHSCHTGSGLGDPFRATCETCSWTGTPGNWQQAANDLDTHRAESREWHKVERMEAPGIVYAVQDENYDSSGLLDVFASLHAALVANPYSWMEQRDGWWLREDGDAIKQTALSISRVIVQRGELG